ncbi:MAG: divergent PAP2 family protein [Kiritimatiellia bacterium]
MENSFFDLLRTPNFWSPFLAWLVAQSTKMLVSLGRKGGRLDFRYLVSTGGMPSAHTSMVCGLATSVGLTAGFGSPVFVVALTLAVVVVFDASTVRQAAGRQAKLLNEMVQELFQEHRFSEQKLAELLGHTRLEVFLGAVMGVLVAFICTSVIT